MKSSFKLKEPNGKKETLILFSCEFKEEKKKFIYSTGERIHPDHWDKKAKAPNLKGVKSKISPLANGIKMQLDRYVSVLLETENRYTIVGEKFTSTILRKAFDLEFKKVTKVKDSFLDYYDLFVTEKKEGNDWSAATIKRYANIRNILENFQTKKKYTLTFSRINADFHRKFTNYCMGDLKHINNTYARNLGLFKTFMFWALKNNHTYNDAFKDFKKEKRVITKQIALTIEDLNKLMAHEFESKKLEKVRDIFVFACVTGMRFGELSLITKSNVNDTHISLKEQKDTLKTERQIPLTSLSKYILKKYDYNLPLIANQKHNEYIKEVFAELEYIDPVQQVTTRGSKNVVKEMVFKDRISSHTARRTFITMMKAKGKSDKLIAGITGHKDMKTLNSYYQVEDKEKKEAVNEVFNIEIPLKKIN